jgi:hypothetical protein
MTVAAFWLEQLPAAPPFQVLFLPAFWLRSTSSGRSRRSKLCTPEPPTFTGLMDVVAVASLLVVKRFI